jgi:hypothetical protein
MLETIKTVGGKVGRNEYIERHLVTYILHKTELHRSGRVLQPFTSDEFLLKCIALIELLKLVIKEEADRSLKLLSVSLVLPSPIYRQHIWNRLPRI